MTTATVRAVPHGDHRCYWRGCRRPECTTAAGARVARSRYLLHVGQGTICSSDQAARHIWRLRGAKMSDIQIRAAARLDHETFHRILNGRAIRRATEHRVLAVGRRAPVAVGSLANVDVTGSRRRLQALGVAGWPELVLAARMGMNVRSVQRAISPCSQLISHASAAHITALCAELWDKRPEDCGVSPISAKRTRRLAARHGWHPLLAWDDIDDPSEVPQYGARASRVDAVVEDATELIAEGYSREAIAERLGLTWDAVRQAFIRKGVLLPELAA
jgi:hypothetical protein